MIIVNNNTEANEIFDENTYYNISFVSTNAQMLNRAIKDSNWVAYFTSAEHNAELQSQVVNLYNTASSNPSYFTETVRTFNNDYRLDGNCT